MEHEKLKQIQAIISDVDGVMTDGGIIIHDQGETKHFNVRDGMGIKLLQKAGLDFALLSGRASSPVSRRAAELGIEIVKTGRLDKQDAFFEIIRAMNVSPDQVAFIGDDIPDLAPLRLAGIGFCPQDAVEEVLEAADHIAPLRGGQGVVRYVVEAVLKARGLWRPIVQAYEVRSD